jgi:hypothetical protein
VFAKGQVSTEYLVNLSVVVLVALIVVTMITNASSLSSDIPYTQSKNYWGTGAPFVITEWKYSHKSLEFIVTNLDSKKLYLNDILIDSSLVYTSSDPFNPGESRKIIASTKESCGDEGDPFELRNVQIHYTRGEIIGFTQKGTKPIIGFCIKKAK